MGRRFLAIYDWIARVHFALFALGGITFVGAAVAVLSGTIALAAAMFIGGVIAIVFGALGWLHEREPAPAPMPPPTSTRPSQTDDAGTRWLPEPSNLLTFAMTNRDLDEALRRAKSEAKRVLARDAEAAFDHIDLLPAPRVVFLIWSRTAYKHGWLYVTERAALPVGVREGPPFTTGADVPVWSPWVADPPTWKVDKTWLDLVRDSWYRVRPFTGKARLRGILPMVEGQEEWGSWSVWFEVSSHPLAGGTKEVVFGYRDGHLEQFER